MTEAGRTLGYAQAVSAASLWGSSGIFAVYLFRFGLPPETLALLRPVIGLLFVVAFLAFVDRASLQATRRQALVLILGGGALIGTFQYAYLASTDAVGVPTTVALLYLAPAVVAAASGPLLKEWPSRVRLALVVVTLTGVWLSVLGAESVTTHFGSTGVFWGVIAGLSYGGYTIFGRMVVAEYGPARTVVYSTLGSCLVLAVLVPVTSGPPVVPDSGPAWATLLAFCLLTISVAHFLFFAALERIEASRAAVATAIEPVVAAVLATLLLGQGLRPLGWLGIALVVAGVAGAGLTDRPTLPEGEVG